MELNYEMRQSLRRQVGPVGAGVLDVLAHRDAGDGDGVEITTQMLAAECGVSAKTVQRTIANLVDGGLVSCQNRFHNNRQVANRYHLDYDRLGTGHSDSPGGQGDQAIGVTKQQLAVVHKSVVSNSSKSVVLPRKSAPQLAGEGLRPSVADSPPRKETAETTGDHRSDEPEEAPVDTGQAGAAEAVTAYRWPPRNSPMPLPSGSRSPSGKRFFDDWPNALWLVSYFEGYVVDKANGEKAAKGRKLIDEVGKDRKLKWSGNALNLVVRHPVSEVAEVIDWLFTTQHGYLPIRIAEYSTFPDNRKVTRLQQVEEVYELLLEAMASGSEPDPVEQRTTAKQTRVHYGKPLADPDDEAKVTELVGLFTEFRLAVGPAKEIHQTRTWRWAKSFRIMLANRGREFDDLKLVVTALRDCPEMDRTRYNDAYDLDRGAEWEHVLAAARLAQLRADRKPSRDANLDRQDPDETGGKGWHDINELLDRWAGDESSSDDEPRSLDMAARPRKPPGYYSQNRAVD